MIDQVRPGSRQGLPSCKTPPWNRKGYWAGGPHPPPRSLGWQQGSWSLREGSGTSSSISTILLISRLRLPQLHASPTSSRVQRSPFFHVLQEIYSWLVMLKLWVTEDPWVGEEIPTSCSSASLLPPAPASLKKWLSSHAWPWPSHLLL